MVTTISPKLVPSNRGATRQTKQ